MCDIVLQYKQQPVWSESLELTIINTAGAGVSLVDWIIVNSSGICPWQAPE